MSTKANFCAPAELNIKEKVINNKIKQEELGLNSRLKKYLDRVKKIKLTIPKNSNEYDFKFNNEPVEHFLNNV